MKLIIVKKTNDKAIKAKKEKNKKNFRTGIKAGIAGFDQM